MSTPPSPRPFYLPPRLLEPDFPLDGEICSVLPPLLPCRTAKWKSCPWENSKGVSAKNAHTREGSPGSGAVTSLPKGRSSRSIYPPFILHPGRQFGLQPLHPLIYKIAFEEKTPDLGRLSPWWASSSDRGTPFTPLHPTSQGRRASGGRLYESRPGPGVEEGSAASPRAPFLLLYPSPPVLRQPDAEQQSPIPHH